MQLVSWIVKQTGKISDSFNQYNFYVKQQPQVIDSSSVVSIQTYNSRDMTATIPCSFKWFTVRNGLTTQIPHFKGNTFICQPNDVGCQLQVQITSSDPQCKGTAILTYGPVKFDILLKKQIQMGLLIGQSIFTIDIDKYGQTKQCQIRIEQKQIHIYYMGKQVTFTFDYNMYEPKIQGVQKISTKVNIIYNPKYYQDLAKFLSIIFERQIPIQQIHTNPFIQVSFSNRKIKDTFIYITKIFNNKKLLKQSQYVSNLQKQLDFTKIIQNNKTFDYLLQITQLNDDLNKMVELYNKGYHQKRIYIQENKRLQKQIEEIVSTYVKIIEEKFKGKEDFEKSFIVLKQKQEQLKMNKDQKVIQLENQIGILKNKINFLQQQNKQLKSTIGNNNKGQIVIKNSDHIQQSSQQNKQKQKRYGEQIKPLYSQSKPIYKQNTQKQITSPFKKKGIFQVNSSPLKQQIQIKKQLQQIKIKYQKLTQQYERINKQFAEYKLGNINQINVNQLYQKPDQKINDFNLDHFDAKSVKSNRQKSNPQQKSHLSSSLILSKDTTNQHNKTQNILHLLNNKPTSPKSQTDFTIIASLQQQNSYLKKQLQQLTDKISSLTIQYNKKQQKYKKKISDLQQQLQMYKRNNDILNRSQHLSMQMQSYNEEQLQTLKKDNQFLKKQIQNYQSLSQKYMIDAKKYKQLIKNNPLLNHSHQSNNLNNQSSYV